MARRRLFSRSRRDPLPEDADEAAPGSQPRADVGQIIDRYVAAAPSATPVTRTTTGSRARLGMPPRAAAAGELPTEHTVQVGDALLPPGRRRGRRAAALWASDAATREALPAWRDLASEYATSGLWPVLLSGARGAAATDDLAWIDGLDPVVPAAAAPDADAIVAEWLAQHLRGWGDELDDELRRTDPAYAAELEALMATDAAAGHPVSGAGRRPDALAQAGGGLEDAHLGLVGCTSPAQLPERLGWTAAATAVEAPMLTALLASWEARYGALVLALEPTAITLAVTRPPATASQARDAAAEQLCACPAVAASWDGFEAHAATLLDAPAWRLRWDSAPV